MKQDNPQKIFKHFDSVFDINFKPVFYQMEIYIYIKNLLQINLLNIFNEYFKNKIKTGRFKIFKNQM